MYSKTLEIQDYLPRNWTMSLDTEGAVILAPSRTMAQDFYRGAIQSLRGTAEVLRKPIRISWPGCTLPLTVQPIQMITSSDDSKTPESPTSLISSYAPNRIRSDASYEEVLDFIKGKRLEGLIVTVTSMVSDRCLICNDLQILDRGGGWTLDDWTGIDFKKLWIDSFLERRTNYYGQLIDRIQRDRFIPGFEYDIRRPSGALARYESTYTFIDNFGGAPGKPLPVRVAISKPGDWYIVEDAPDGSEVAR